MKKELLDKFNKYVNSEFYSGYLYYAMSAYFDKIVMHGLSKYMKHFASKELAVAQKMHDYLILRNEKLSFLKIDEPKLNWKDTSDIFENILMQEKSLSREIQNLYLLAKKNNDIGATEFIKEILIHKMNSLNIARNLVLRTVKSPKITFCKKKNNNFSIKV